MDALTAAAAGLAPIVPPRAWFVDPELDEPTPLTVTSDGRVFGHVALWDSCHVGFPGRCIAPPTSRSGYAHFHLGLIETDEGELPVGKITLAAGHASTAAGVSEAAARAHYDDTGTVAAFVRAGEDMHGIWVSGAIRDDLPVQRLRDLRANPPSGDWRGGEMIAVHCVPTPGFPVPRASIAASALLLSTGLQPVGDDRSIIEALAASVQPVDAGPRYARPGRGC